jgi:hypothetical protein
VASLCINPATQKLALGDANYVQGNDVWRFTVTPLCLPASTDGDR